ncbi:unnamed protein product [Symbiodinium necroappetens]|uniref:Uncharacterized protein n=1 Tax=Symbiodinium necroappetens TaxID=1628268 RepID=A0A813C6I7_9DINO|nr:unnamed protein product [Symbiodinium necroappetens]
MSTFPWAGRHLGGHVPRRSMPDQQSLHGEGLAGGWQGCAELRGAGEKGGPTRAPNFQGRGPLLRGSWWRSNLLGGGRAKPKPAVALASIL